MATVDPRSTYQDGSGPNTISGRVSRGDHMTKTERETKVSFLTTEFWAMVAVIGGLVATYNASDNPSLDLFRTCLLATVMASAYVVSRGWAKSGSHDHWDRERSY